MAGNDIYTRSLLHFNGDNGSNIITDSAFGGSHTWTTAGAAQLDTSDKKFGSASLLLDGSSYIYTPRSPDFGTGTNKYTVDFWVKLAGTLGAQTTFFAQSSTGYAINYGFLQFGTALFLFVYESGYKFSMTTVETNLIPVGIWTHLAVVRNGITDSDWYIFVNGVPKALNMNPFGGNSNYSIPDYNANFCIGTREIDKWGYLNGRMEEFRFTNGSARWTTDFSANLPTSEYSITPSRPIILFRPND